MAHIICNRRRFLGGMAAGLMATPFLPRFAGAGVGPVPKRIVFIFTPNGTIKENWLDWNAPAGEVTEHGIEGMEFKKILQPFEEYRQSMLVMRGVNMEAAYDEPKPKDHWPDYMNQLTGRQPDPAANQEGTIAGISIDQLIANEWATQDGTSPIHSVQLGMLVGNNGQRVVSAGGAGNPLRPDQDPFDVYTKMFDGVGLDAGAAAKVRAKRGRMIDAVRAELHSAECQLTGDDRVKLQKHLAALTELEDSLDASVGACTLPEIADINHTNEANLDTIIDQQFSNLYTMLSCRLTRVATVMMGGGNLTHGQIGHTQDHHYFSHDRPELTASEANVALTDIDHYYAGKIVGFLDMLRNSIEDDGSSLLDHTLVLWCHEQSTGAHQRRDMPYVMVGGNQIPIPMGRVIHAGGNGQAGTPHATVNDLWITVANRLGIDIDSFGDPSHVNGSLAYL
jgi:hypothetical protein